MTDLDLDALLSDAPETRAPSTGPPTDYADAPWYPDLLACTACPCRAEASRVVPGEGPLDAQVAFLGRNPGFDEDQRGRPFVGRSGSELDAWIEALGWDRAKLLVLNLLKCYTKDDREPTRKEIATCTKTWFAQELKTFDKLAVLIPLGDDASRFVLGNFSPRMGKLALAPQRVKLDAHPDRTLLVVPMAHPAYALHSPRVRGPLRDLVQKVREFLERQAPDAYRSACP